MKRAGKKSEENQMDVSGEETESDDDKPLAGRTTKKRTRNQINTTIDLTLTADLPVPPPTGHVLGLLEQTKE